MTRRSPDRPVPPRLPPTLEPATVAEHDLYDEAAYHQRVFGIDLSDRAAESVELEQCRLVHADLSGTVLPRLRLVDCEVENTNLANLRAEKASMVRVALSESRMTGVQWLDGTLHDVVMAHCRADLAGFRFTTFRRVRFEQCNLTRADFQNADLGGAEFVDCDLGGAQFSYATLAGARFQRCDLTGIGGVTSFQGAVLVEPDLVSLVHTLAAGLGIQLTEAGESTID